MKRVTREELFEWLSKQGNDFVCLRLIAKEFINVDALSLVLNLHDLVDEGVLIQKYRGETADGVLSEDFDEPNQIPDDKNYIDLISGYYVNHDKPSKKLLEEVS